MARLDNHYIKFKGSSSAEMGCHVQHIPARSMAEAKGESVDVLGRNGSLFVAELQNNGLARTYKDTEIKITLIPDRDADLDAIRAWLTGSGELVISDETKTETIGGETVVTEFAYDANVIDAIPYTSARTAYGILTIDVTFNCAPLRHLANEQAVSLDEQNIIAGRGDEYALPLFTITTEGRTDVTLLVNGVSVLISGLDGSLTLDCDAQYAYDGAVNLCGKISIVSDPDDNDPDLWPYLIPDGNNLISWLCEDESLTATTTVTMIPRWRWR